MEQQNNAKHYSDAELCKLGQEVVKIELNSLKPLAKRLSSDKQFAEAVRLLLACQGRIIVTGMGKSGHIGHKIAATMASTGSPAFFVHPGEAGHGDLGMIKTGDVVLAISYSGSNDEILTLIPHFQHLNVPLISMTESANSPMAQKSAIHLDISVSKEACPHGLAPTSSTTATLIMGDALAITLLKARGFTERDFAFSHPAGRLGRRLILQVKDLMRTGDEIPVVNEQTSLSEALLQISDKCLGMTTVVNDDNKLTGVFTDGDLRRTLQKPASPQALQMKDIMSANPRTISQEMMAIDCLHYMERYKITSLIVVDDQTSSTLGIIHIHDLLKAGLG